MKGYKDREIKHTQSKVYFNLHKKLFSVKQKGLVVLHSNTVVLKHVRFEVNEKGRQRVLSEQRKNVHAYVNGQLIGYGNHEAILSKDMREAYYNPYKTKGKFVDREDGYPLEQVDMVILTGGKIYYK